MDSIRNPFKTGVLWPNGQSGINSLLKLSVFQNYKKYRPLRTRYKRFLTSG